MSGGDSLTAPQLPSVAVGETSNGAVDFSGVLDSGELLTGTPTVEEQTTSDLTSSNKAVNTAALTIDGSSVAIGEAVQFAFSGQLVNVVYTLKITAATDATPPQTKIRYVKFAGCSV